MVCSACAAANAADATICAQCGQPLGTATTPLPALEEIAPARASGICPPQTLLMMIGTGLLSALVVGVVYHLVTRFIDLLIVFPIGAGLAIGAALGMVIQSGKCRSTRVAFACGLMAGVLCYATQLFLGSRYTRPEMVHAISQSVSQSAKLPEAAITPLVEKHLTPLVTFQTYMQIQALAGVNIGHPGSTSSGIPLKGNFFWLLLTAEVLAMGLSAAFLAKESAASPFCERCLRWSTKNILYRTHPKQAPALLEKVRAQDWEAAGQLPTGGQVDNKNLCEVFVNCCSNCQDSTITVKSTAAKGGQPLLHARLLPRSVERLVQLQKLPRATAAGALASSTASTPVSNPSGAVPKSSSAPSPWS